MAAHQALAQLVAPPAALHPGGESSAIVEDPLFPDERDEDKPIAKKPKREALGETPRELSALKCG